MFVNVSNAMLNISKAMLHVIKTMLNVSLAMLNEGKAMLNVSKACALVHYRYNNQVKRLKALRDSHPIIGLHDGRYTYELLFC